MRDSLCRVLILLGVVWGAAPGAVAAQEQSSIELTEQAQEMLNLDEPEGLNPEDYKLPPGATYNRLQMEMGKIFGIPPDSPELKFFSGGTIANAEKPQKDLPSTILGHYVLTRGIPLPDPRTLSPAKLSTEQQQMLHEALQQAQQDAMELQRQAIERWGEAKPLESCSRPQTRQYNYAKEGSGKDVLILDLLFVAKPPPLNPDELFGRDVTVIQYKAGDKDPLSAALFAAGVPCLPYRVRVLNSARYEYEGSDALRNFSSGSPTKGKVDPKLRSVLKEYE